jgi:cobalamin synthase
LTTDQIGRITADQLDGLVGTKSTADIAALFTDSQVGTTAAPAVLTATQLSQLDTAQIQALRS